MRAGVDADVRALGHCVRARATTQGQGVTVRHARCPPVPQASAPRRCLGRPLCGPRRCSDELHLAQRRWRCAGAEKRPFRRLPRSRCAVGGGGQHGRCCDPRRVRCSRSGAAARSKGAAVATGARAHLRCRLAGAMPRALRAAALAWDGAPPCPRPCLASRPSPSREAPTQTCSNGGPRAASCV
jgi:hypothetical protein